MLHCLLYFLIPVLHTFFYTSTCSELFLNLYPYFNWSTYCETVWHLCSFSFLCDGYWPFSAWNCWSHWRQNTTSIFFVINKTTADCSTAIPSTVLASLKLHVWFLSFTACAAIPKVEDCALLWVMKQKVKSLQTIVTVAVWFVCAVNKSLFCWLIISNVWTLSEAVVGSTDRCCCFVSEKLKSLGTKPLYRTVETFAYRPGAHNPSIFMFLPRRAQTTSAFYSCEKIKFFHSKPLLSMMSIWTLRKIN